MLDLAKVESDFKEDNGYWFTYPDDEDIQIKIRPLFPDKAKQLTNKSIKIKKGIKEIDEEKLAELTRNHVIEDWKGIEIAGNIECTNQAKEILSKYCAEIITFILAKSNEIANTIASQDEEQIKNLKSLLG